MSGLASFLIFAAEEGEHHENNFWYGDINEVIWGSVAFAIVLGLMIWKGLPALKAAMLGRTERIQAELAAADVAQQEAAARRAAAEAALGNPEEDAKAIVADAAARAEALKADLRLRAETDIEAGKSRARIEIEASKSQLLADLRAEVAARTAAAAEAVAAQNLDHDSLIDQYITQVGAS